MFLEKYQLEDFERVPGEFFETKWVDPNEVNHYQPFFIREFMHSFRAKDNETPVLGGWWDRCRSNLKQTIFYKSMEEHFVRGVPWEETIFVKRRVDELESDEDAAWGIDSRSDLEGRCESTDQLFSSITQKGFLPPEKLEDEERGVMANIGRDGTYIAMGGRHRITLASIAEIDRIPVQIALRHREFVE